MSATFSDLRRQTGFMCEADYMCMSTIFETNFRTMFRPRSGFVG